mgnify:CR=1 FL=1
MTKKLITDKAFILAAGFGKRMYPITKFCPKPLVEFKGKPLIHHLIENLLNLNINEIIINSHYLHDVMSGYIKKNFDSSVILIVEKKILNTGGGVKNAIHQGYFKNLEKPFFLLNGDIYLSKKNFLVLKKLSNNWENKMEGLITLKKKKNLFGYNGNGDFDFETNESMPGLIHNRNLKKKYVYAGITLLKPKIFMKTQRIIFPLLDSFNLMIKNDKLFGLIDEEKWLHLGTVDDLNKAKGLKF